MIKNISRLEHKIGEKTYHFYCDNDCSTLDVKEALFQFIKFIGQVEDYAKSQQQEKPVEESKDIPEVKTDIAPEA